MPGPFDEYLSQAVKQQPTPQPTGWEGAGSNIAFIASKFLEGAKQARAHRFMQEQMEQDRQRQGYEMAIKAIDSNPNLLPAKKEELRNPLIQGLIGQVVGSKENSKITGHPMTDMVKNIFTNMTGGQMGNKAQPLDMAAVGNAFTQMQIPENSIQHHLSAGSSELGQLLQSMGPNANAQAFMANPSAQAIINRTRETTGMADWLPDILKTLPVDPVAASIQAAKVQALSDIQKPASSPAPVFSTTPIPGAAPVPKSIGVYSGGSNNNREVTLDTIINAHLGEKQRSALGVNFSPDRFKIDDISPFRDTNGNLFYGRAVTSADNNYPSGVYDINTNKIIPGARPNTAADANRLTPEQIKPISEATKQSLIQAVGPDFAKPYLAQLQVFEAQGDKSGMDNVVTKAIDAKRSHDSTLESRAFQERMAQESRGFQQRAQQATNIKAVYDDYASNPILKEKRNADIQIANAHRAYEEAKNSSNKGLADVALIRAVAKLTDIQSSVREGEYATFESAMGRLAQANVQLHNLIQQNGNKLNDDLRAQMLAMIDGIGADYNRKEGELKDIVIRQADVLGVGDQGRRMFTTPKPPNANPNPTPTPNPAPPTGGGLGAFPGRDPNNKATNGIKVL